MDTLSDIFETIRLRATLYFRTSFSPPWAITMPAYGQAARFHLVVRGTCHVTLAAGPSVEIGPGDLILIPRGREHVLADCPGRQPAPLEQVLHESGFDGRGAFVLGALDESASTELVCGHFGFSEGADHPLLRALPEYILMSSAERAREPLLDETLQLVVRRAFSNVLGAAAATARLSEVFFIEMLRASIGQHRGLGRILEAMGEGPMSYLANWRLQRALLLLRQPDVRVQDISTQVGYQSAAAFTRAFTRKFGVSPSAHRRGRR